MKVSVKKTLSIHAIVVVILLFLPIIALTWISNESNRALEKTRNIYSNILIELVNIDGALKNARFHSYAAFMHDSKLSVAHYHDHPLSLHLNQVEKELKSAERSWERIHKSIIIKSIISEKVHNIKNQYDNYINLGGTPVLSAIRNKDWDSIVRIVTNAIPEYSKFSGAIKLSIIDIKKSAADEYSSSLKKLSNLKRNLNTLYILSILIYIAFSFWLQKRIINPLNDSIKISKKIASGNLTKNNLVNREDEFGMLSNSMEEMRISLSKMINDIIKTSDQVGSFSQELKIVSSETAKSIKEQMYGLTNSASSLEQLLVSIEDISLNTGNTNAKALEAEKAASISSDHVNDTETGVIKVSERLQFTSSQVEALSEQLIEITSITNVIQNVAAQTNLLALNAAIEAARAGEQGRGFAVVADEVRNLAATTTESVDQISTMITDIQTNASSTVKSMKESCDTSNFVVETTKITKNSINEINKSTSLVQELVFEISRALNEQKSASTELSSSVESIAGLSQENTNSVSNVAKTAESLAETSKQLKNTVSMFKL